MDDVGLSMPSKPEAETIMTGSKTHDQTNATDSYIENTGQEKQTTMEDKPGILSGIQIWVTE